jgi:hypothetical protein
LAQLLKVGRATIPIPSAKSLKDTSPEDLTGEVSLPQVRTRDRLVKSLKSLFVGRCKVFIYPHDLKCKKNLTVRSYARLNPKLMTSLASKPKHEPYEYLMWLVVEHAR